MSLIRMIQTMVDQTYDQTHFKAVVQGTVGNLVTVKRVGQSSNDPQSYPRLSSYTPVNSDEVMVVRLGNGYLVLGKITR